MMRPNLRLLGFAVVTVIAATTLWAADEQYEFMPDGGRGIIAKLLSGLNDSEVKEVLTRTAGADDWALWAGTRDMDLDEAALQTLAGYAELNLPLSESNLEGLSGEGLAAALPKDGKDLAVAQCQFCHSLFSGYLMHDRDKTGWQSTFKAPFHTEIPMSDVERETFASYSAINMPLKFDDVPPELRF